MIRHVCKLEGAELDWAVAKATGFIDNPNSWLHNATVEDVLNGSYHPSECWEQAGTLIDAAQISLSTVKGTGRRLWEAEVVQAVARPVGYALGPTGPIAVARCYVTLRLGDTVELPETRRAA